MIFEERQLTIFIVIPSEFSVMISVTKLKLKLFRGLLRRILRLSFILRKHNTDIRVRQGVERCGQVYRRQFRDIHLKRDYMFKTGSERRFLNASGVKSFNELAL